MIGDIGHHACRSDVVGIHSVHLKAAERRRLNLPILVGVVLVLLGVLDARGDVVSGHFVLCVYNLWFWKRHRRERGDKTDIWK